MSENNGAKPSTVYGVDRDLADERVRTIGGTPYSEVSHEDLLADVWARLMAWLSLMADDMGVGFGSAEDLTTAVQRLGVVFATRIIHGSDYDFDSAVAEFFVWFNEQVDEV